jgi:hypothetical protein
MLMPLASSTEPLHALLNPKAARWHEVIVGTNTKVNN